MAAALDKLKKKQVNKLQLKKCFNEDLLPKILACDAVDAACTSIYLSIYLSIYTVEI